MIFIGTKMEKAADHRAMIALKLIRKRSDIVLFDRKLLMYDAGKHSATNIAFVHLVDEPANPDAPYREKY